jgi:hypothetical protein
MIHQQTACEYAYPFSADPPETLIEDPVPFIRRNTMRRRHRPPLVALSPGKGPGMPFALQVPAMNGPDRACTTIALGV